MSDASTPFVARESDVQVLEKLWEGARAGTPATLRLQAPFGGGRRAVCNTFLRALAAESEPPILWRVSCVDQENGLQWLVRMYGALVATLASDVLRRGKIEMMLNAQLPNQPARVQAWYQQFIASLKEAKTDTESGQVQLRIPQDNPLIGLVEITCAIASRMPMVLEIQNPFAVNSLAAGMFLEALHAEARERSVSLFVILHDEPDDEVSKSSHPMPLLDFYGRTETLHVHDIAPWTEAEVTRYLDARGKSGNAARIATIAKGRPGFVAELVDILDEQGRLGGDLADVTLASLVPMSVDADEIDAPDAPPKEGERVHATEEHAGQVAFFAALLGTAFPSGLVADMGGFERESVDDLLDAMSDLFEEVQRSEELQSWIYRFTRGSWREGVLEANDTEEGHDLARRVGMFMERYLVPRGYGFIVKTARLYAEHQAYNRAALMRSLALSNDNPDIWGLAFDLTEYFDEIGWPDTLLRTVYMNLLDRMVGSGNLQTAERIHAKVTEWATKNEDREMTAWLLYAGSRLDTRRQDLFRARDRAGDALKMYEALGNRGRMAEIHNHLAQVELNDGNPNAAMDQVNKAMAAGQIEGPDGQKGVLPAVFATGEHIRGLVLRRAGKPTEAAEHFRTANEVAGQAGISNVALEAGLAYGEALFASGNVREARDILERVLQIARALRNAPRERNAAELLAQAEGALRNFQKALPLAQRVLELTTALKYEQALPIDLYNLGFFHHMTNKPTEALTFFQQSESRLAGLGPNHPVVKELHYFKGLAHMRVGQLDAAKASLNAGLKPARDAKDWRKLCSALENLATIEQQQGNREVARKLLGDAIETAKSADLRDERRDLRKKLDALA
ncbi:MAG: tetratricopeptide repeat protein [Alphaproteobacteria bacterium]|nr:tetratricopeptide repeat protein [Alphaproteobacteria bacterium]